MGNYIALFMDLQNEVNELHRKNKFLEDKLEGCNERIGKLEKDIINTSIKSNLIKEDVTYLGNRILNIDLLEQGRSYIGGRKSHTASMYSR